MLNLNFVMLGSSQPKQMGEFYEKVLAKKADMEEGNWYSWQLGDCGLSIGEHSEVEGKSKEPARAMLVFQTEEVQAEFERIKQLGAEVIKEPYEMGGMWIATFADPDGNYFQLMSPWENNG